MRRSAPQRNVNEIPASNIQFWVGEGSNEVVAAFFACGPSEAGGVAYGFRFNGSANIQDMLSAISAADSNFSIDISSGFIYDVSYQDEQVSYVITGGMMMYTVNGDYASGLSHALSDGDYFELTEWGDCNLPNENIYYPTSSEEPSLPEDATISAEEILYWVGNGSGEAIVAVNWCDTALAMAWGVRFDGDSALVADLMRTIALYDSRFSYNEGNGMMNDILFQDGTYDLSLQGSWWTYNINGAAAMNGFNSQYVRSGDLIKWGDESCGVADELYNYAWTTPIQPVALPAPSGETFDGIAGSDGFQAISYDNPAILGWATGCSITRGPQDIANADGPVASFGEESAGTDAASLAATDAVSLGDGGMAILTFNQPITNGIGYDFAVFENSLNDVFLELAFVEVSSDGIHFYRFPSVSNTPTDEQLGNGGETDATRLHNLAGKHRAGWGTPFDLEELSGYSNLDINNITHVRLVDVVGSVDPQYGTTDKNGHLINDPYPTNFASGGFDLTGVAILNGWEPSASDSYEAQNALSVYPNPCTASTVVTNVAVGEYVALYNAFGQLVWSETAPATSLRIDLQNYPAGIYFVQTGTQRCKVVKR